MKRFQEHETAVELGIVRSEWPARQESQGQNGKRGPGRGNSGGYGR